MSRIAGHLDRLAERIVADLDGAEVTLAQRLDAFKTLAAYEGLRQKRVKPADDDEPETFDGVRQRMRAANQ